MPTYHTCAHMHTLHTHMHTHTHTHTHACTQGGDVIELIEQVDEHWYYARNADCDMEEGLILGSDLNIVKRLPGQDTVAGFEEGPCAIALHEFHGREYGILLPTLKSIVRKVQCHY